MLYSKYKCYCGFENTIKFKKPTHVTKAWLESDCLACDARYEIRVYEHDNKDQVNIFKRLIKSSEAVDRAIAFEAKQKNAFKFENNGVLNGESAIKKGQSN